MLLWQDKWLSEKVTLYFHFYFFVLLFTETTFEAEANVLIFFPDLKQTNTSVLILRGLVKAEKALTVLITLLSFSCLYELVMS